MANHSNPLRWAKSSRLEDLAELKESFRRRLARMYPSSQLELDFRPRRQRWTDLDCDGGEDAVAWPKWFKLKLHLVLLDDMVRTLSDFMRVKTPQFSIEGVADQIAWLRSENQDIAFSFEACCEVAGVGRPDLLRENLLARVGRRYRQVLADAGTTEAAVLEKLDLEVAA